MAIWLLAAAIFAVGCAFTVACIVRLIPFSWTGVFIAGLVLLHIGEKLSRHIAWKILPKLRQKYRDRRKRTLGDLLCLLSAEWVVGTVVVAGLAIIIIAAFSALTNFQQSGRLLVRLRLK